MPLSLLVSLRVRPMCEYARAGPAEQQCDASFLSGLAFKRGSWLSHSETSVDRDLTRQGRHGRAGTRGCSGAFMRT